MFSDNLIQLRKLHHLSQEELAEKLDISRQTLSKWETGESMPDIGKCQLMAALFGVTLDDLVNFESPLPGLGVPPKGKHVFSVVTLGEKGQIVLPAQARKLFGIEAGDRLLILGDEDRGIAVLPERDFFSRFFRR